MKKILFILWFLPVYSSGADQKRLENFLEKCFPEYIVESLRKDWSIWGRYSNKGLLREAKNYSYEYFSTRGKIYFADYLSFKDYFDGLVVDSSEHCKKEASYFDKTGDFSGVEAELDDGENLLVQTGVWQIREGFFWYQYKFILKIPSLK